MISKKEADDALKVLKEEAALAIPSQLENSTVSKKYKNIHYTEPIRHTPKRLSLEGLDRRKS